MSRRRRINPNIQGTNMSEETNGPEEVQETESIKPNRGETKFITHVYESPFIEVKEEQNASAEEAPVTTENPTQEPVEVTKDTEAVVASLQVTSAPVPETSTKETEISTQSLTIVKKDGVINPVQTLKNSVVDHVGTKVYDPLIVTGKGYSYVQEDFDKLIEAIEAEGNVFQKYVVAIYKPFVTSMSPKGPIRDTIVAGAQSSMVRFSQWLFQQESGFKDAITLAIMFHRQYRKTVFADHRVFRGMEQSVSDAKSRLSYYAVATLFNVASDVRGKSAVTKKLSIRELFRRDDLCSEEAAQRFVDYFTEAVR